MLCSLQVDVVVTTAGGIEEDLIKCLAPTYKGDFALPGAALRSKALNRIGNLLVPNDNYCKFEDWIMPIFDQMYDEQSNEVYIYSTLGSLINCVCVCDDLTFLASFCIYYRTFFGHHLKSLLALVKKLIMKPHTCIGLTRYVYF